MPETSTAEKLKWADHPYLHSLLGLRFPKNEKWKDLFRGRSLELFGIFFDDSALDSRQNVEIKLINCFRVINNALAALPKGTVLTDGFASKVDRSLTSLPVYDSMVRQVNSIYKGHPLRARLDFIFGIINLFIFARNAFMERTETGQVLPFGCLAQVLDITRLLLRDRPIRLVDRSRYGFSRDEMDTNAPASEASADDNILTPSTSESASVADTEEPVQEPISTCSMQPVVPESSQSLDPGPVQRSTHDGLPPNPPGPLTSVIKDEPDSVEAKDTLGKDEERCNVMSSRIELLEKENHRLQTRFVIEQTLHKRTTLSLHAKEKELCGVQEAFSKLWQAHRRQLNNGLEASGIEGLTWGADDAGIYLDSLDLRKDP